MSVDAFEALFERLAREAGESGYNLNPDDEFTRELVEGLLTNIQRYGYPSCPCRLAEGDREVDRDIICPCDYRDPDLSEHGCCFCALYVSNEVVRGGLTVASIPERRPPLSQRTPAPELADSPSGAAPSALSLPVWRCSVCGYLCAREEPPGTCPICKVDRERFSRFI